ncbi:MAG TPA: glycoside hydrolase family 16 protein [Rubrobacteraceae bacterium]|nr:glycoside hydrolase family 16 protein [Rubrobacteraceae bacterium]
MPVDQRDGWTMTFHDEFKGTTLDTTKWVTCYPDMDPRDKGCIHGDELQRYLPENVIVSDGTVKLRAQKENYVAPDGEKYKYTSGMITTGKDKWDTTTPAKFTYQYGYMEMRAKVPHGQGLWSAFWTLPWVKSDPGLWPPEIDVVEILGHNTAEAYMTYHWRGHAAEPESNGEKWTGPDLSQDFHTYGALWEPSAIRWFIYGREVRAAFTDDSNIASFPQYLLANLAVGGSWPGAPEATTPFPSDLEIDHIRVWQKQTDT